MLSIEWHHLSGSDVCWHSSFQRAIRSQPTRRQATRRVDINPVAGRAGKSLVWDVSHCCHYIGWVVRGYGGYRSRFGDWLAEQAAKQKLCKYAELPISYIFQPIAVEHLSSFDLHLCSLLMISAIKCVFHPVKLKKQHPCSSVSQVWSNDLTLCFWMTLLSRMVRTNGRSSFAFSLLFLTLGIYTTEGIKN